MKKFLRSVWAIFAGFLVVFFLSYFTDFILGSLGVLPKGKLPLYGFEGLILFVLLYRNIFNTIGSYITARLAPHHPLRHAIIGGSIGVVFSSLGAIANSTMKLGPDWYAWGLVILALPTAWLGGKWYVLTKKTIK